MNKRKTTKSKTSSHYWDDSDWAIANAQMLSEHYPNMWVAVYNKKVIAHGKNLGWVVNQAQKLDAEEPVLKFSERGIHVYTRYHYDLNPVMILSCCPKASSSI